jgi:hypothetical protein
MTGAARQKKTRVSSDDQGAILIALQVINPAGK